SPWIALLAVDLDAPVLGATFGRLVVGDRLRLAEAARRDAARAHALRHHVILHGVGATLRELLVVGVRAHRVRVSLDRRGQRRLVLHRLHRGVDEPLALGLEVGLVEVELWPVQLDDLLRRRRRRRSLRYGRRRRFLHRIADRVTQQRTERAATDDTAADR